MVDTLKNIVFKSLELGNSEIDTVIQKSQMSTYIYINPIMMMPYDNPTHRDGTVYYSAILKTGMKDHLYTSKMLVTSKLKNFQRDYCTFIRCKPFFFASIA